jgi:hypothetical protein
VRHRHDCTLSALAPPATPPFPCSPAQPSSVSPHHKPLHCHNFRPPYCLLLRSGCWCVQKPMCHCHCHCHDHGYLVVESASFVCCKLHSISMPVSVIGLATSRNTHPSRSGQCLSCALPSGCIGRVNRCRGRRRCVQSHLHAFVKTHLLHPITQAWLTAELQ